MGKHDSVIKKIEGYPMYLPIGDHGIGKRLWLYGGREFAFMWVLRKEASGVAIDVGANIGYCTLSLASRCEHVYAYEPDPRSFGALQKNLKLNKCVNVDAYEEAIGKDYGVVEIALAKKPNLSSVFGDGEKVSVQCKPLYHHIPDATFIKMDIEGAEVGVLAAVLGVLMTVKKMKLLIEVHPKQYGPSNNFAPVLERLVKSGYEFKYVINAKGKIDKFSSYRCVKRFKQYKYRAVFEGVPADKVIPWATEMPDDGKKVIRSVLLCRS